MGWKRITSVLMAGGLITTLSACYSAAERYDREVAAEKGGGGSGVEAHEGARAGLSAERRTAEAGKQLAQLYLPKIRLAVAELQVIPAYASPGKAPNVEQRMRVSLQDVAAQWARKNIEATGSRDRASVIIRRASIVEQPVRHSRGVAGLFKREPDRRYDAVLEIAIEVRDDVGAVIGRASATATRKSEALEGADEEQLQALWAKMTDGLVADAARELDKQIKLRMSRWAR
jgi:hypothetical protein